MIRSVLLVLVSLLILGCESTSPTRPMSISTNLWIGYSPLYYAEKKGWLRENNIKLIRTVSLGESLQTFKTNSSDMCCVTQYEIQKIQKDSTKEGSIILLDRSNGGDYILANRSIDQLKLEKKIDVYLETESVNIVLLEYFMIKYALKSSQVNIINSPQIVNAKLKMKRNATLIVTYDPYNIKLQKKGYKEIASTKDRDLIVIDAIYAPAKTEKIFHKELGILNILIYKSLKALEENPVEYFETINQYFDYDDYVEFQNALASIEWIYSDHTVVVKKREEFSALKMPKLIKAYSGVE